MWKNCFHKSYRHTKFYEIGPINFSSLILHCVLCFSFNMDHIQFLKISPFVDMWLTQLSIKGIKSSVSEVLAKLEQTRHNATFTEYFLLYKRHSLFGFSVNYSRKKLYEIDPSLLYLVENFPPKIVNKMSYRFICFDFWEMLKLLTFNWGQFCITFYDRNLQKNVIDCVVWKNKKTYFSLFKRDSLLCFYVNYGRKKVYEINPWSHPLIGWAVSVLVNGKKLILILFFYLFVYINILKGKYT